MQNFATVVLAAGKGTRMKSSLTKVLHPILGKPMLYYVLETVRKLQPSLQLVVVGHQAERVKAEFEDRDIHFVLQKEQLGTGHAVKMCQKELKNFNGHVLILYGDTPLLKADTLKGFIEFHQKKNSRATVLTAKLPDPSGYGRIIRDANGTISSIVEDTDLTREERKIQEVNSGIYLFDAALLVEVLDEIKPENAQGEYYLTDAVAILREKGVAVYPYVIDDYSEITGVNDRIRLAEVTRIIQSMINEQLMADGVTMIDPDRVYIQPGVKIMRDVTLYPDVIIEGNTSIGEDTVIGPGCRIVDSSIGSGVEVQNSIILESNIGDGCTIGPFAYIRPGTVLDGNVKIGDFVEVKKSRIGNGTKVPHLSYVGDATIGKGTNIGAGTITANYDGKNKNPTIIGNDVFIGSNSTLVAPVKVGDRAMTGAGSVVTKDVEKNSVVVGVPAKHLKRRDE